MTTPVTAQFVFEQHQKPLELSWVAGEAGGRRQLDRDKYQRHLTALVGHLNLIRPCFIQVMGNTEIEYLNALGKNSREDALDRLFQEKPLMLIITEGVTPPEQIVQRADESQTPLLSTPLETNRVIDHLRYNLSKLLSEKSILHGVFMEVMGLGILLTGPSGVGKSELALELLSRGHRLIADDATEFRHSAPGVIHGYCPTLLADFMEVRGLGILNIRAMYGSHSVLANKRLHLIIQIQPPDKASQPIDRLDSRQRSRRILDVDIPEVILPVAPGRDLAVIIEAAVRNHVLYLNGYNAAEDFIKRQQHAINMQSK